jgi:ribulose-5-phosphate 4-epimerase/fuculose-1-phosphate aldolase
MAELFYAEQYAKQAALEAKIAQLRQDLAAAYQACHLYGLNEGIDNHLTVAIPDDAGVFNRFLVIPYGLMWNEVTASKLCLVDATGKVLEGEGQPDITAFMIHSRMHLKLGAEGACIMHTHMPHASALCCTRGGVLEMCHQNSLRFYKDVVYDSEFNGLVFDAAEGDRIGRLMGSKHVYFHANHGVMVTGATVAEALERLYYLERAAHVQILAMSTGLPLKIVDDSTCRKFQAQMAGTGATTNLETGKVDGGSSAAHYAAQYFTAVKRQLLTTNYPPHTG